MSQKQAFSLEAFALVSRNYFEKMVDAQGQPYFDVFYGDPAEAAHDWPDFGDVASRQYQGAIMLRHMSGVKAATEDVWQRNILSLLSPEDGLLYRPETGYSKPVADMGDQSLTLYALATAQLAEPSEEMERAVRAMVRGLEGREAESENPFSGFMLKPLLAAARAVPDSGAWGLAERLMKVLLQDPRVFPPDDVYPQYTHVHGTLRTLVGAADYARTVGDAELLERVYRLYRFFRSKATDFGFLPEAVERQGDIVTCETCALMDYVSLGVALANAGYTGCWWDVERVARNHLVESQARDLSWLVTDETRPDTEQFTWRGLRERLVGAYAGWSSPTHFLGAEETLGAHWGGPELKGKTRLFQNCCGGSGVHAFFALWKNVTRFSQGRLTVNLHMDKRTPEVEVRSQQPYRGRLELRLLQDCAVSVRLPGWLAADHPLQVTLDGSPVAYRVADGYVHLERQQAGATVALEYPLPVRTEEVTVGNVGFQQYSYRVTWKGDTVIDVTPAAEFPEEGYSDFDKRPVRVYFGEDGPGRLYQRQEFLADEPPVHAELHEDQSPLDLW